MAQTLRDDLLGLLQPWTLEEWRAHERDLRPFFVPPTPERQRALQSSIPAVDLGAVLERPVDVRWMRPEGATAHEHPAQEAISVGDTLQFFKLSELYPELIEWEARSERALGLPPGGVLVRQTVSAQGGGFPWHYDASDAVIAQVRGTKRWLVGTADNVWQPADSGSVGQTTPRMKKVIGDYAPPSNVQEYVLEPGALLFIPRGVHHHTLASDLSQSLSIRLRPPMWLEVAEALDAELPDKLVSEAAWRARSYGAWGFLYGASEGRSPSPGSTVAELAALLARDVPDAGVTAEELLSRFAREFELHYRGAPRRIIDDDTTGHRR